MISRTHAPTYSKDLHYNFRSPLSLRGSLTYYGLQVIGSAAVNQNNAALIPLVNQLRFGPGIAFIVSGLLCVAAATIVMAAVAWKSQALPKWSGIPLAAGFAVYIPQLQGDPIFQVIRIGVGILILIGCCWLAWGMVRRRPNIPVE